MFDLLSWLLIIGVVTILIYNNTFWFRDIEKIAEKYAEEFSKIAERNKESVKSWGSPKEMSDESEKELKSFIETHENYLHLIERFIHDKRGKQVKKDWKNYLRATKTKFDCDMDYTADLDGRQLRNTGQKNHMATITIEEIEKRFNRLLEHD